MNNFDDIDDKIDPSEKTNDGQDSIDNDNKENQVFIGTEGPTTTTFFYNQPKENMDTNRGFETNQENQDKDFNNRYYQSHNYGANNNYNRNFMQIATPNSGAILTLGIISIVSICCCFGVGIVFAIIALALVPGARKSYYENPDLYTQSSFDNIKTGQICAIIGLVMNALLILYFIFLFSIGESMLMFNESFNDAWNGIGY